MKESRVKFTFAIIVLSTTSMLACSSSEKVDVEQILQDCRNVLSFSSESSSGEAEQMMEDMVDGFLSATCEAFKEECQKYSNGEKCQGLAKSLKRELDKK